ncbi:DUF2784 domain-containing protein [Kangiella profundi]|uniref:DUF2784 domain-containing protein n=1 Tax=Kangiella profundi TaxID=1561924 RepID=A0A2K9B027_9GAMM|nr:DUF2784 domain-containing protein [Kangiella profundi]AUD78278.1 DUF2784 domain-containing protein [Kangiella profundi]GGF06736.1 hypothetical protein GCM10011356_20190 [Kangiella profundi]
MNSSDFYILLADLILIIHALFVVFVVTGLIMILIGGVLRWSWVRNPWFRLLHLIAIGFVVIQTWLGAICPLTIWENALRKNAGEAGYQGSFISYWLETILYYQFPQWVFAVVYSLFGLLVLASWFWVRPRPFKSAV